MIRRRLRGILRTTVTTAVPWTALGFIIGMILRFGLIPDVGVWLSSPVPGGLVVALMLAGAMIGVVNGLTLSAIVLAAERGRKLEDLRTWRFAAWGAVATAGTLGFFFESPLVAAIGAALGGGAAAAALAAARRARAPQDIVDTGALGKMSVDARDSSER